MKKVITKVSSQKSIQSLQLRVARAMKLDDVRSAFELANFLGVSYEAVRRELCSMRKAGLVMPEIDKSKRGRPFRRWHFTVEGEHLFPKNYDSVLGEILDVLSEPESVKTAHKLLEQLAMKKADEILARAKNSDLKTAIMTIYGEKDDYISVEVLDGNSVIVEKNCPILKIAKEHPIICSVSTNAISKSLGQQVIRSEKFQSGHGRCVFVAVDSPYSETFVLESDLVVSPNSR